MTVTAIEGEAFKATIDDLDGIARRIKNPRNKVSYPEKYPFKSLGLYYFLDPDNVRTSDKFDPNEIHHFFNSSYKENQKKELSNLEKSLSDMLQKIDEKKALSKKIDSEILKYKTKLIDLENRKKLWLEDFDEVDGLILVFEKKIANHKNNISPREIKNTIAELPIWENSLNELNDKKNDLLRKINKCGNEIIINHTKISELSSNLDKISNDLDENLGKYKEINQKIINIRSVIEK